MRVNITDFKVIYICPDHNQKYHARKEYIENVLRTNGFKHIEHYKSSSENYPNCLLRATIDILQKNMNEPFLLLEDDVEFENIYEFNMDENVDAIYLGLSVWGSAASTCGNYYTIDYEPYSDSQVRIMSMLSGHAILYISSAYKQAVINTLLPHIHKKIDADWLVGFMQSSYLVLAEKKPFFFQSSKFNNPTQELYTRFTITDEFYTRCQMSKGVTLRSQKEGAKS
jgi:hypothetical protein